MTTPEPTILPEKPRTFRALVGAALQKQRLRRGLTQSQLAEYASLSLKYVGEIERGEANTTLDALDRLAKALDWDPISAFDIREPITEGVRLLLLEDARQTIERTQGTVKWLQAIDPARHANARLQPGAADAAPTRGRSRPRATRRPTR